MASLAVERVTSEVAVAVAVVEASVVVVVVVEVALEIAAAVEGVDEADLGIVAVVEVVEAAPIVAASATSQARKSPSRAFPLRLAQTVRPRTRPLAPVYTTDFAL